MKMNKCIICTKSSKKNENFYILIFFLKKYFFDFKRSCVLQISRFCFLAGEIISEVSDM